MNNDERREASEKWSAAVAVFASRISANMRLFGIEMTPDEAYDMALEELKLAVRQNLRELFLEMLRGKQ